MSEVLIKRFVHRHDAEFAQGYLEDAGIPALVVSDDGGGMGLNLSFVTGAMLRVSADDEERALVVLRDAGVLE